MVKRLDNKIWYCDISIYGYEIHSNVKVLKSLEWQKKLEWIFNRPQTSENVSMNMEFCVDVIVLLSFECFNSLRVNICKVIAEMLHICELWKFKIYIAEPYFVSSCTTEGINVFQWTLCTYIFKISQQIDKKWFYI